MSVPKHGDRAQGRAALLGLLARVHEIDRQIIAKGPREPQAQLLALWQARRLAATYEDFSSSARYHQAAKFFLNDLYGPADFTQRDADLEKVFPVMSRMLPANALDALCCALELHALTQELDARMLKLLTGKLAMTDALTPALWARAYRMCGQEPQRRRQIELVVAAGRQLDEVVKHPMIYTLVRLVRGPARAAGFGALQDFVERGFRAFRSMQGAAAFIDAVGKRETAIMRELFAGNVPTSWQHDPGSVTLADLTEA